MKHCKIVLIHGNQTLRWNYAWLPWLTAEIQKLGLPIMAETFPDSVMAREQYWIKFLEKHAKADQDTIMIGHSSGAVCAMRYAETHRILGSILVAAAYTDLEDDLEKQSGYFDRPWNWGAIKRNQQWIVQFASADDEYIPIAEARHIHQQLNSQYFEYKDRGHFLRGQKQFPEVLRELINRLN